MHRLDCWGTLQTTQWQCGFPIYFGDQCTFPEIPASCWTGKVQNKLDILVIFVKDVHNLVLWWVIQSLIIETLYMLYIKFFGISSCSKLICWLTTVYTFFLFWEVLSRKGCTLLEGGITSRSTACHSWVLKSSILNTDFIRFQVFVSPRGGWAKSWGRCY